MPSSKNCLLKGCKGLVTARCEAHLKLKKFCSVKCSAASRKNPNKMADQVRRQYKMMNNNPEKYIKHLLHKPNRKHLDIADILDILEKQKGLCAISNVNMTFIKEVGKQVNTNLSIDQIEAGKGYSLDNIQLVCTIVNKMKSNMTYKELLFWCNTIGGAYPKP